MKLPQYLLLFAPFLYKIPHCARGTSSSFQRIGGAQKVLVDDIYTTYKRIANRNYFLTHTGRFCGAKNVPYNWVLEYLNSCAAHLQTFLNLKWPFLNPKSTTVLHTSLHALVRH